MSSRRGLEREDLTRLAVRCRRVADNPSSYSPQDVENAEKLIAEWASLQKSPDPELEKQREIGLRWESLSKRMVEFLDSIL